MFEIDVKRLKEFFSQDKEKIDLTFEGAFRSAIKRYYERYQYCKKIIVEYSSKGNQLSLAIDSATIKRIRIVGKVTDLKILEILKGNVTADFPNIDYLRLDRSLQTSVERTLGYVTLIFSEDPEATGGPILKQLKGRKDIKETHSLPDVDPEFLILADSITVENSYYEGDDPTTSLFHEKALLNRDQSLFILDYTLAVASDGEITDTERVQKIFDAAINIFPPSAECTINGW